MTRVQIWRELLLLYGLSVGTGNDSLLVLGGSYVYVANNKVPPFLSIMPHATQQQYIAVLPF